MQLTKRKVQQANGEKNILNFVKIKKNVIGSVKKKSNRLTLQISDFLIPFYHFKI